MEKVNLKRFVTHEYERQAYNSVLTAIEQQINRGADGYLYTTNPITAAYSVTVNDCVILADGTFTVTLPAADQCKGKRITIKNIGAGTITLDAATGNIDGSATQSIATTASIDVVCDGINYFIV